MHPTPVKKAISEASDRPSQSLRFWNSRALKNRNGCIQVCTVAADLLEREAPQTWQKRAPIINSEPHPAQALSSAGIDCGWVTGGCQNSWVGLWTACDIAILCRFSRKPWAKAGLS